MVQTSVGKRGWGKRISKADALKKKKLKLTISSIERTGIDMEKGIISFKISMTVDGKSRELEKRTMLNNTDKMLKKFISSIKDHAKRRFVELKYFASSEASAKISIVLTNETDVKERMLSMFKDISDYKKSGNTKHLRAKKVVF